jgi:hypothetical protein
MIILEKLEKSDEINNGKIRIKTNNKRRDTKTK